MTLKKNYIHGMNAIELLSGPVKKYIKLKKSKNCNFVVFCHFFKNIFMMKLILYFWEYLIFNFFLIMLWLN